MMKYVFGLVFFLSAAPGLAFTKEQALGISKGRIELLQNHFAALANICFQFNEECGINGNSQEATVKWLNDEMSQFKPTIRYSAGADNFTIDGALRIAKTGNDWGSPVYFNEDLLAVEKTSGDFQPLGFFDVLGIFIHEFGHHQTQFLAKIGLPPLRHEELDEIAAKIVKYLKDRTRRTSITSGEMPGLQSNFLVDILQIDMEWNNGIRNVWSKIFIDSPVQHREISQALVRSLKCPKKYQDGHLVFVGKPYFASFQKVRAPRLTPSATGISLRQEVGTASVMCVDERMGVFEVFSGYTQGVLKLHFNLRQDGALLWEENDSSFTATPPEGF